VRESSGRAVVSDATGRSSVGGGLTRKPGVGRWV
jgi:hypothetical protein